MFRFTGLGICTAAPPGVRQKQTRGAFASSVMFTLWFWFFYKLWFCLFVSSMVENQERFLIMTSQLHHLLYDSLRGRIMCLCGSKCTAGCRFTQLYVWTVHLQSVLLYTMFILCGFYLQLVLLKHLGIGRFLTFFPKGIIKLLPLRRQSELRYNWGDVPNNCQIFVNIRDRYRELCTFAIVTALRLINFSDMAMVQRPLLLQWLAVG